MPSLLNRLKMYRIMPLHELIKIEDDGRSNFLVNVTKVAKLIKMKMCNYFTGRVVRPPESKMFWCKEKDDLLNFGDEIGPYIYQKIKGINPKYTFPKKNLNEGVYLTAGSIMGAAQTNSLVWGSGIMYEKEYFLRPYKTYAVRGPYTRKRYLELGYDCPEIYGDPGLVLPKIFYPNIPKKFRVGIIPHFIECTDIKKNKFNEDILVIDLRKCVEEVVKDIMSCEKIVSSSLHGIIVAHAYGIPAAWMKVSNKILGDDIKYYDYFASVGLVNIRPLKIEMSQFERIDFVEIVEGFQLPEKVEKIADEVWDACPF